MTVDVRVRTCSLTIRRRDGWSWGSGPEPHLEAALAGIEAALASAFAEAGLDPSLDATIEAPVRLSIGADGAVDVVGWRALVDELRRLPDQAPAAPEVESGGDPAVASSAEANDPPEVGGTPVEPAEVPVAGPSLARMLGRWSRSGQVARLVGAWPEPVVRAWVAAVEAACEANRGPDGPTATLDAGVVDQIATGLFGDAAPPAEPRAELDRLLTLVAALAATLGDRLPDAATLAVARARIGAVASGGRPPPAPASARARSQPVPDGVTTTAWSTGTAQIVPATPFLVIAELERIGYVDAMVAAAEASALPRGAAVLGAAVAGKVLPPPTLGWARQPTETAVVALASGQPPEWLPAGVAEAVAAEHLALPLASALVAAYAEGRSAHEEVIVGEAGDGLVCGEAHGLLPAAWVASESELADVLDALGRPPTRRTDAFEPLGRELVQRIGFLGARSPALERVLGAAVGTALGLLALDLWRDEAGLVPTPLLALDRLADLEARVEPTADGLVVAIPRGQRWLDLRRAGLLDWFPVPWLSGGRMEIGTW